MYFLGFVSAFLERRHFFGQDLEL